jgi:hypothetical protein
LIATALIAFGWEQVKDNHLRRRHETDSKASHHRRDVDRSPDRNRHDGSVCSIRRLYARLVLDQQRRPVGGQSAGDAYTLGGIGGQAEAGELSGGAYTLSGGFWQMADFQVYLPIVLR